MMDAPIILLLLFVSSLTSQQARSQDVDITGGQAGGGGSSAGGVGQPRTIYNQRHLSPHRMMHFGKRPAELAPPTIMAPRVYDLVQPQQNFPYLFSIELERGQTLQSVPEELNNLEDFQQNRNLMYSFEPRQLAPTQIELANSFRPAAANGLQQQQQQLAGQKFLRLVSANGGESAKIGQQQEEQLGGERAQASANSQDDNQSQQQQQAINVSTRSLQSSRANTLSLPKAYISSLLYGRQGSSSLPNFASYNKKAEPKENFFMHFGRK